jgi:glycosyltransferase involved in cell wall biosynthesis
MSSTQRIAVIIPAYNEALTITDVIQRFHAALPEAEFVVVDNRSTDGTGALAEKALQDCGARGQMLHEPRPGKGNAVRRAFYDVYADVYVMIDADMTYHPEDLPAMLAPVLKGEADLVVGDRLTTGDYHKENKRPFHNLGNALVKGLINKLFRVQLRDVMSGYRVMTRRFVEHTPILRAGFELETESTIFALDNRFRIVEVPIKYTDRPAGSFSKLSTFRDGARVLSTIFHILRDYRPSLFFGSIAGCLILAALAAGSLPIYDYIQYRYVYRVPMAILATGMMLLGMMFAGISLILTTIKSYFRSLFEMQMMSRSAQNHPTAPASTSSKNSA